MNHWHQVFLLGLSTMSRRSLLSTFAFVVSPETTNTMRGPSRSIRILIHGGDNMLGRAVQLTFPVQAPREELITDSCTARHYLNMGLHSPPSEQTLDAIRQENRNNGHYLWQKARVDLLRPPDLCLLNLETAITKTIDNSDIPTGKGINYHMHVDNFVPILSGLPVQTSNTVATLANNHGLDFGRQAFEEETIPFFAQTSSPVQMIGCGRNFQEAAKPAILECAGTTVQVFAVATGCSGTP
jgi:hypothetical protein